MFSGENTLPRLEPLLNFQLSLAHSLIIYTVGRKYGRYILTRQMFHKFLPPEKFDRIEERFNKNGAMYIVFGRHIPGLRAQIFLASGILRLPFFRFFFADAFSSVWTIGLWLWVGFKGGEMLPIVKQYIKHIEFGVLGIIAVVGVGYIVYYLVTRRLLGDKD